jgi:hypothetical protein
MFGCLALMASTVAAAPKRKPVPDKFVQAASKAFGEGVAAEDKGDLDAAIALYSRAFEISPHPSAAFNLAEVQVRKGLIGAALASYEVYLALAPTADDRKQIEALIVELATRPQPVELWWDAKDPVDAPAVEDAYVLLDGDIVFKPGEAKAVDRGAHRAVLVKAPPGPHTIDVVTAISFATLAIEVPVERDPGHQLRLPSRVDGAMIISAPHPLGVTFRTKPLAVGGERLPAPSGVHLLAVHDSTYECPPVPITVPSNGEVAYTHVMALELPKLPVLHRPERCRKLAVKQRRLAFSP